MTQAQSSLSLKLGIKTLDNIGIILNGGYKIGESINLYNNDELITDAIGKDEFFVGFNIQYLKYF